MTFIDAGINFGVFGGAANEPPIADAGPDQSEEDANDSGDHVITLDGSGSSDPEGGVITYSWAESEVEIATGVAPTPTFTVGSHTVVLTVTDNKGQTDTDTVIIEVTPYTGDVTTGLGANMSASSVTAVHVPSRAVDDVVEDGWVASTALPQWLKIDYGAGNEKIIARYTITGAPAAVWGRSPGTWTLEGSNNDSDWDVVDTVAGANFSGNNVKLGFTCDVATTPYRYYKYVVTNSSTPGPTNLTTFQEMEMFLV